jgi:hypothetical protein
MTTADQNRLPLLCDANSEYRDSLKLVIDNGYTHKTVTRSGGKIHRPYPRGHGS